MPDETALNAGLTQLADVLMEAAREAASDVHVTAGMVPWVRRGGLFDEHPSGVPVSDDVVQHLAQVSFHNQPGSTMLEHPPGTRWRVEMFESIDTGQGSLETGNNKPVLNMAFRRIPAAPVPVRDLGLVDVGVGLRAGRLASDVLALSAAPHGLVLLCGSSGSGKSTTIASLVKVVLDTRPVNVITLESPIEYVHHNNEGRVQQREMPADENERVEVLKSVLRSDADVVVVGEVRTPAEISAVLDLAATGHLVFTTLHASNAAAACHRVAAAVGSAGRMMLADVLRAIITQRLLPDRANPRLRHLAAEVVVADSSHRKSLREGNIDDVYGKARNDQRDMAHVLKVMAERGLIQMAEALAVAESD